MGMSPGITRGLLGAVLALSAVPALALPTNTPSWSTDIEVGTAALGFTVDGAGDVNGDGYDDVIVGAPGYPADGTSNAQHGGVFVYYGSPMGLSSFPDWMAIGPEYGSGHGTGVAGVGDVNDDGYDDIAYTSNFTSLSLPAVYLHLGSAEVAVWGVPVAGAGDVDGDGHADVIVGAPGYDGDHVDCGRVFVFRGTASGLSATPDWTIDGAEPGAGLGFTVAMAGDVDNDGYADVIVADRDEAMVHHGSASGLVPTATWRAPMTPLGPTTGWCQGEAATAGDVDNDGFDDVVVGSPAASGGGSIAVYHGSSGGLSSVATTVIGSVQSVAWFGCSVATADDADGDGFDDVIVGATLYDNGEVNEGGAFIYPGGSSGVGSTPAWVVDGGQESAWLGHSVRCAGDVNGDSRSEMIVGAPSVDVDWEIGAGKAFVYHGAGTPLPGPAGAVLATTPLLLARDEDGAIVMTWGASCRTGDADFAVYRGDLGDFTTHQPVTCSTGQALSIAVPLPPDDSYFLVAPLSADHEGSHGLDGEGNERAPGTTSCAPQEIGACN
jgi:hypothetical protein